MKLKNAVFAIALSLVAAVAQAAPAPRADLGTLAGGDTYLSGSEDLLLRVGAGSFYDIFNFSLSATSNLYAEVTPWNSGKFSIVNFQYSLFGEQGNAIDTGYFDDGFSALGLAAGSYHLDVTGTASGSSGGKYNGLLSVVAVPEPESYSMFLAGLGLMGIIARRRRSV